MENPGSQFLNEVFNLNKSPGIDAAARRAEVLSGEKVPQKVESRVQNYLDRLQFLLNNENPQKRERARSLIRQRLHDEYIVTPDQIVDYRLRTDQRIARQQGHGNIEITPDIRDRAYEELGGVIEETIGQQIDSLDAWMDYLLSEDVTYPDWFRYWVFRSILELAPLDKDKHMFPYRKNQAGIEKYKFQPFPEIDQGALARLFDEVENQIAAFHSIDFDQFDNIQRIVQKKESRLRYITFVLKEKKIESDFLHMQDKKIRLKLQKEARSIQELENEISKLREELLPLQEQIDAVGQLRKIDFAQMYASSIEPTLPLNERLLQQTEGKWAIFKQGSDPRRDKGEFQSGFGQQETPRSLLDSIEYAKEVAGVQTHWCSEGESTARSQLQGGDFYVYYSLDEQGQPTIPRVAIRMDGDSIGEVRGIADNQNLDPYVGGIVQEKLAEFPDGKAYEKKTSDMSWLTTIENRMNAGRNLTKDELIFLYEINGIIEGFGYQRDPRIAELRARRDPIEDAPVVLDCDPGEIAWNRHEVSTHTKAYIGPLFPRIFEEFSDLEHIYTSFPEGKITRNEVVIGTKDRKELLEAMKKQGINISSYAQEMIESPDFMPTQSGLSGIQRLFKGERSPTTETIDIVRLKVRDFGFTNYPTTTELFAKAEKFGLELCPAEVGPQYRLQQTDQPMGDWFYIGMKSLVASGDPNVFELVRNSYGLWLSDGWATPDVNWDLDDEFVFRFRKNS